jgi:hypothetical protein
VELTHGRLADKLYPCASLRGYKLLLFLVNIFTRRVEAFPSQKERSLKVTKELSRRSFLGLNFQGLSKVMTDMHALR